MLDRVVNVFTQKVFHHLELETRNDNVVFAGASCFVILTILKTWLTGHTKKELSRFLSAEESTENRTVMHLIHSQLREMEQLLAIDNADSVLFHSSEISEKYKKMSKAHRMNLEKIDFTNLPEAIRVINEWITKHTNGQMFNVIRELDAHINMALVSVFMRQITWVRSFNPTLTKKKPFYAIGKTMEVEMMKRYYIYNVTEAKFANFAFIPINHNHQQAVIILPNEGFTLDDVFKHFKFIDLPIYYQKSSVSYLKLKIPKFTLLESKDMVSTLKHFNVSIIFESNNKDFKDLAGENGFLKTFLQVVNVEVKEARTIYFSNTDDDAVMGGWKTDFICDRPFYFLVYDHNARIVLLAAAIKNPNAA